MPSGLMRGLAPLAPYKHRPCLIFRLILAVSSFCVSSRLMTVFVKHSQVLNSVFETLAFLAESRQLRQFTRCLLTYCNSSSSVVVLWL